MKINANQGKEINYQLRSSNDNQGDITQTNIELSVKLKATINEHGVPIYEAPIEIHDKADLNNYGITWNDCRTIHFGTSDGVTVYFFKTSNRSFAEEQWKYLNSQHSKGYRSSRCLVPGKLKPLIVCPDSNKCSACPFGRKPEDREPTIISWDGLIETGYEPESEDREMARAEARREFEDVRKVMDKKDPNIARAIVLKEMYGYSVAEIANKLNITERQVYYLIAQAKTIGKEYAEKNQ